MCGEAAWPAAFNADPDGSKRKLLVVRVEDCVRPGLLGQVISFDLFDAPEADARDELVRGARLATSGGQAKPPTAPAYPGGPTAAAAERIYGPGYANGPVNHTFGALPG